MSNMDNLTISVRDASLAGSTLVILHDGRPLFRCWQTLPFKAFQLIVIHWVKPFIVYVAQAELLLYVIFVRVYNRSLIAYRLSRCLKMDYTKLLCIQWRIAVSQPVTPHYIFVWDGLLDSFGK